MQPGPGGSALQVAIQDLLDFDGVVAEDPLDTPVQLPEQAVSGTDKAGANALADRCVSPFQFVAQQQKVAGQAAEIPLNASFA